MTEAEFRAYYDGGEHVDPYGEQVEEFAFALLAHQDAARIIRHEVFKEAYEQCAKFEPATAWAGDQQTNWEGLKAMTRTCCLHMIVRPNQENPLAKTEAGAMPERELDFWYRLVRQLPFEYRQVMFLNLFFRKNLKDTASLLNKSAAEVKRLQASINEELVTRVLNVQKECLRSYAEAVLLSESGMLEKEVDNPLVDF